MAKQPAAARPRSVRKQKLRRSFYSRSALEVAQQLIGKILVRRIGRKLLRAQIVETEAYLGPQDLASHSSKGRTKRHRSDVRTRGPCLRLSDLRHVRHAQCRDGRMRGEAARRAHPWGPSHSTAGTAKLSGPGRSGARSRSTRSHNGLDLTGGELYFLDNPAHQPRWTATKRINVDYAGEWKHALCGLSMLATLCHANNNGWRFRSVECLGQIASQAVSRRSIASTVAYGIRRAAREACIGCIYRTRP